MGAAPPWFDEDLYSLYYLLDRNISARRAFVNSVHATSGALRAGQLLDSSADRDAALRANHVLLASELHKALDLFVAVARAGQFAPAKQFAAVFNPKNKELDDWLDSIEEKQDIQSIVALFPYSTAAADAITGEAGEAVDYIVQRNARSLRAALVHARKERRFLGPFRNRWAHTTAFQLFGTSKTPGETLIPVLKVPTSGGTGEELGIVDRVLLESPENDAAIVRMIKEVYVWEFALVEARLNCLRNTNKPYLPRFVFKSGGERLDTAKLERFVAALRERDKNLLKVQFDVETGATDETITLARDFYAHSIPYQ